MGRVLRLLSGTAAAAMALTACTSAGSTVPDYQASPGRSAVEHGPGIRIEPILPIPSPQTPGGGGGTGGSGPSASTPKKQPVDPLVMATDLRSPVGLAMLPDGSALVGERTTGRIVRVQPEPGRPVPTVKRLTGLDSAGDGGLLDLALSPSYSEDRLIYAYVTTPEDNRVVAFTLDGPVTPVITGIPRGRTGNAGRLLFSATGTLSVGTGDAGRPGLASNRGSLAGKVLRITDIGGPAANNPRPGSPVFTRGHSVVDGLCADPGSTTVFEVETGSAGAPDEINVLVAGRDYSTAAPLARPPAAYGTPGGCAVLDNRLWITSLDGRSLLWAPLPGAGSQLRVGPFKAVLTNRYGRLRTVVAAADGALWLTTSNRDGNGAPVKDDERVIRYVPRGGGEGSPV